MVGVYIMLQYKAEDFIEFDSLVHMNASDTTLPLGGSSLPHSYLMIYSLSVSLCRVI